MADPQSLGLKIIPFNIQMRLARRRCKTTQRVLAKACGVSLSLINHIETLRIFPSLDLQERIACALGEEPDYLFPQWLRVIADESKRKPLSFETVYDVVLLDDSTLQTPGLIGYVADVAEKALAQQSLAKVLSQILDNLPPRARQVIELRFGLRDGHVYSLEEVSVKLGTTRERVRQIEAKALRRFRHPRYQRELLPFLEDLS